MKELKILNTREVKDLFALLKKQFDFSGSIDYAFLKNKDDIYIISRDIANIDTKKLNINNLGLYFGEIKHNELRLSIDACNLIGKDLGKNILTIDGEAAHAWLKGEDILIDSNLTGFVIIKHKNDYLGTGRIKDSKLINFVPKERRVKELI